MDNPEKSPTVLSLCTGYGGIEIGIEKAIGPITPVAHVEIEAFAIANLVNKMETGQLVPVPIWTNLKTFHAYAFRDKVDILTGGYPCQPFSAAGKRKGKEDPRHLWPWIREIIKAVRPGICFFENVEGHISLGLREVLTDLAELGYRVENDCGEPTWGLFSAAEVGAPHQRKRVFIMAYSECSINRAKEWYQAIRKNTERSTSRTGRPGGELENTSSSRSWDNSQPIGSKTRPKILRQENRQKRPVWIDSASSDKKLAYTSKQGSQRGGLAKPPRRGELVSFYSNRRTDTQWPSRPGQPQYNWENPRVLADTKRPKPEKPDRGHNGMGRIRECVQDKRKPQEKTEPQLGRTINGNRDRVDRLRLCGNGVVPDQAAKAFIVLMNRILNPSPYIQPSIQRELF